MPLIYIKEKLKTIINLKGSAIQESNNNNTFGLLYQSRQFSVSAVRPAISQIQHQDVLRYLCFVYSRGSWVNIKVRLQLIQTAIRLLEGLYRRLKGKRGHSVSLNFLAICF